MVYGCRQAETANGSPWQLFHSPLAFVCCILSFLSNNHPEMSLPRVGGDHAEVMAQKMNTPV